MAEGKALASNSLCVAGRDAAGPCAGAIGTSETEHSGRLFIWAFMMWFFGRQVFVPPPNLLIHRPRHIGQDARPIHNRPCPAPPPAPSDGTVLAVNIRPGEFATIGGSTPPVLLGRLDPLHVRVDIDEADVP